MTVFGMSKITSKGQVTLPASVRRFLKLDKGECVAFCVDRKGVFINRCKLNVEPGGFSELEWRKIEKLAGSKGRASAGAEEAKKHIRAL